MKPNENCNGAIEGFYAFNDSVALLRNATYRADIRFNYNKSNDILSKHTSRKDADATRGMHAALDPNGHYYIDTVGKV